MSNRAHYGITAIVTSLVQQQQKIREITDLRIKVAQYMYSTVEGEIKKKTLHIKITVAPY